jgi:hypothetical protein
VLTGSIKRSTTIRRSSQRDLCWKIEPRGQRTSHGLDELAWMLTRPSVSLWRMAPADQQAPRGYIQPPAEFGSRQARSKGSRHAWGATS